MKESWKETIGYYIAFSFFLALLGLLEALRNRPTDHLEVPVILGLAFVTFDYIYNDNYLKGHKAKLRFTILVASLLLIPHSMNISYWLTPVLAFVTFYTILSFRYSYKELSFKDATHEKMVSFNAYRKDHVLLLFLITFFLDNFYRTAIIPFLITVPIIFYFIISTFMSDIAVSKTEISMRKYNFLETDVTTVKINDIEKIYIKGTSIEIVKRHKTQHFGRTYIFGKNVIETLKKYAPDKLEVKS